MVPLKGSPSGRQVNEAAEGVTLRIGLPVGFPQGFVHLRMGCRCLADPQAVLTLAPAAEAAGCWLKVACNTWASTCKLAVRRLTGRPGADLGAFQVPVAEAVAVVAHLHSSHSSTLCKPKAACRLWGIR